MVLVPGRGRECAQADRPKGAEHAQVGWQSRRLGVWLRTFHRVLRAVIMAWVLF